MRTLVCAFIVGITLFSNLANAQDSVVTLMDLEQEAIKNNPEMRMAGKKV